MSTTTVQQILTDNLIDPIVQFLTGYLPVIIPVAVGLIVLFLGWRWFRGFTNL